jgi:TolB-like protein
VLRFQNRIGDPEQEYFANGIAAAQFSAAAQHTK